MQYNDNDNDKYSYNYNYSYSYNYNYKYSITTATTTKDDKWRAVPSAARRRHSSAPKWHSQSARLTRM